MKSQFLGAVAALIVGLALAACGGESGNVVQLPADEVFRKLLDPAYLRKVRSPQYSEAYDHWYVSSDAQTRTIVWAYGVQSSDKVIYTYFATVQPKSQTSSRIILEFVPGKGMRKMMQLAQQMMFAAVGERVLSHLENRPFDGRNVQSKAMTYAVLNPAETASEISVRIEEAKERARKHGIAVPN